MSPRKDRSQREEPAIQKALAILLDAGITPTQIAAECDVTRTLIYAWKDGTLPGVYEAMRLVNMARRQLGRKPIDLASYLD